MNCNLDENRYTLTLHIAEMGATNPEAWGGKEKTFVGHARWYLMKTKYKVYLIMKNILCNLKNKIKLIVVSFLFIIETACGSSYYEKTFPLDINSNKQVQNFTFEIEPKINQDKDKSHTIYLKMYFKNADDREHFRQNSGIVYTDNKETNLKFNKMKIKAILKDVTNNKIIAQCDSYPRNFAHGTNDLLFSVPFSVKAMKKGKYILDLEVTNIENFDYSKVEWFEINFTRPSSK